MFTTDESAITWTGGGETLRVEAWGRNSLRVRASLTVVSDEPWALAERRDAPAQVRVDGDTATIRSGGIIATLRASRFFDAQAGYSREQCRIEFRNADGERLLSELPSGGALKLQARSWRPMLGSNSSRLTVGFEADPDEHLVGMGLYQQDVIDLKGSTLELAHRNSQASVPFVVSSRGYGLLWNNPAVGRATFAKNRTEFVAEATQQLDYWITVGENPAAIARSYADATGHPPMMPEYGLGFWQCKLRYSNQEQLLEVAREYRRRGIPIDVIVADFFHWPKMGDYRFEDEFWPDPAAMVRELDELGIALMVSVWPQVSIESENYEYFRERNLLARSDRGLDVQMSFEGPSAFLDVTNPEGRAALWELCQKNYHDLGVKMFWLDEAEPELGRYDFDAYRYHRGSLLEVGNVYPRDFSQAFWDGQQAAGQNDIVNLVRCAWAGSQRYGALVWSGDIGSTFGDLRAQITAGVHMGVAGIPWFTTDIGGFHGGDVSDPAFHELLVRWFQFGAFSPVMRLHGDRSPSEPVFAADGSRRLSSGAGNEVWSFGEDILEVLAPLIETRELLRDYTRAAMREAHETGAPVMRGLFYGFPDDPEAWLISDQYLFGPDLLVCPIVEAGARQRRVYLPGVGTRWTDVRSGDVHPGGAWIEVDAPLDHIPVFGRDGRTGGLPVGRTLAQR